MSSAYLPDDRHTALIKLIVSLIEDSSSVRDDFTGEVCSGKIAAVIGESADVWPEWTRDDVEYDQALKEARGKFLAAQQRREAGNRALAKLHERQPDTGHMMRVLDLDALDA